MLQMSGYWTPNRNHPANQGQLCLFSNRNCHSRCIIWALLPYFKDHSADVNLITSQLANSLRAKQIPCPTRVIQINNSDAGHLVEVTCISVRYEQGIYDHSSSGGRQNSRCSMDYGPSCLKYQTDPTCRKQLADWSKENRVDVLVGSRNIPICYHDREVQTRS